MAAAVQAADDTNEVTVTASIKFEVAFNGQRGAKQFKPAEHKVNVKVKRESLQMTGVSQAFVVNHIDGRYILTDPDAAQVRLEDI